MTNQEHEQLAMDLLTEANGLHVEHMNAEALAQEHRNNVEHAADKMFTHMQFLEASRKTPATFVLNAIEAQKQQSKDSYRKDLLSALAQRYEALA